MKWYKSTIPACAIVIVAFASSCESTEGNNEGSMSRPVRAANSKRARNKNQNIQIDNIRKVPLLDEKERPRLSLKRVQTPSYKFKYHNGPRYICHKKDLEILSRKNKSVRFLYPDKKRIISVRALTFHDELKAYLIDWDTQKEIEVKIGDSFKIKNIEYYVFDIRFSEKKVVLIEKNKLRKLILNLSATE